MSNVIINKAILHILDNTINVPVLSDELIELENDVHEYLAKHIEKLLNSEDNKEYNFDDNNENLKIFKNINDTNFINTTKELSQKIFNIMLTNVDISPCDLIFCIFEYENSKMIGILRLEYKTSFIHKFEQNEGKNINKIVKYKSTLTNINQKIEESFFVDLQKDNIIIKEKKYEIDGKKEYLFSSTIFKMQPKISIKEQYDKINKVTKKIVKEFFDDNIEKQIAVKKEIVQSYNEDNKLDINNISSKVFDNDSVVIEKYNEELKKNGISENVIQLDDKLEKKINKRQKIKTDEGIEILIPIEYLNDSNKINFNQNEDGSINIVLKHLNNLQNK